MKEEPRCIHRHTVASHPNCFVEGKFHPRLFRDSAEFERETGIPWYEYRNEKGEPQYRIGFFDIEVDNLKADVGTILTWAIRDLHSGDVIYSQITKEELFSGDDVDRRLVEEAVDALNDYDIIVGYFSTRFDMAYVRAKALHYGLDFPGFKLQRNVTGRFYNKPTLIHWDLFYTVRAKLAITRKSLERACQYLGIDAKSTPLDLETWRKAKYGDKKALDDVLSHNIEDVISTEALWKRMVPFKKWTRTPA